MAKRRIGLVDRSKKNDDTSLAAMESPTVPGEASPRTAGAHAFVFRLGEGAKAGMKPVPAAYTTSPCYYYRMDRKALGKHLSAIPEPDVDAADIEVTFAAIDLFVEKHRLRRELYSDAELETGGEYAETRGFHTGATFAETRAALARGGFGIVDLARPAGIERDVDELVRHLDLASLDLVLDRIRQGVSGLHHHADTAAKLVVDALAKNGATTLTSALRATAPSWPAKRRDTLLVAVAYIGLRRARQGSGDLRSKTAKALLAALRSFVDAFPPVENETARRRLEAWGLVRGVDCRSLPDATIETTVASDDIEAALALVDTLGFAIASGKPSKGALITDLPEPLRDFYTRRARLGERLIQTPDHLPDLRTGLARWIADGGDAEVEKGFLDARALSKPTKLVPFGKDSSGDYFFFDPAYAGGTFPVLRFMHEEGITCRVEAPSLATFIAVHALLDAYALGERGDEIAALILRSSNRGPRPPSRTRRGTLPR